VLPEGGAEESGSPWKFANHAVGELVSRLEGAGARRLRLEAALVGGASMFGAADGRDIGSRNEAAVRSHLAGLRIPVRAAATGGRRGRTIRVDGDRVTVREAGGVESSLLGGGS
jgi:chemotaxis protein CheD